MVKVRAIINYNDTQLKREVKKGEVLEVCEARAKALLGDNASKVIVAEVVAEPKEDKKEEVKAEPKKTTKKTTKK